MSQVVVRVVAVLLWIGLLPAVASAQSVTTRPTAATQPADPPAGVVRVACVGDSITYGQNLLDRDRQSYPARLATLLGERHAVRNFGVNGATALKDGDRPYVARAPFAAAVAFKPDVVIIGLGTNDTKPFNWSQADAFVDDYKSIVLAFKEANPAVKTYLLLPPPSFYPGESNIRDRVLKDEVIPKVRQVAVDTGATTIDLRTVLDGKRELFPDAIHPNAEGTKLVAAAVAKALKGE